MLLSVNWLRDYLVKSDVKIVPEEIADRLTMRGIAVASIKRFSSGLGSQVVVGKIVKISPHPNADRLQVTEVVTAEGEDAPRTTIVCGAKNISEGDIVPIALPGAVLPGDFKIKATAIRGVDSSGMICSGKELGVSDDGEGILQLPKHAKLGELVSRLFGAVDEDSVLEFELTPNRSDCLSVLGLAREIAPLLKTKLREAKPARFRISAHRTSSIIKVEVTDPVACPRYVARVMDTLKVEDSPDWIKQRLQAVGIRPINNIVDITNFVMLESGQPLHAFDLRKVKTGALTISPCKTSQDFVLLNGDTVRLEEGDILILDGDTPVALAGIMGGANSQIEKDTTSIVLESASFNPAQIRKTAKRLGLQTDASKRFEKGVDLTGVLMASERAAMILRDSVNAEVYHPPIDTAPDTPKENVIAADMRDVRKLIGIPNISSDLSAELLESIGISSNKRSINVLSVRVPSFRRDLNESVDIAEEVARLHGYDNIPLKYPGTPSAYDPASENGIDFEVKAKSVLCQLGFRETIHYSFTSESIFRRYGLSTDEAVFIRNPISEEMKIMRTSLLPALVETYQYNRNRKVSASKLFESAHVYFTDDRSETGARENLNIAGLLADGISPSTWNTEETPVSFYHGKGVIEALARKLTTVFLAYEPLTNSALFHPKKSAIVRLGLKEVGKVGELHPLVREMVTGVDQPVVLFELDLDALKKYERGILRFRSASKFPSRELDIALTVEKGVPGGALIESIRHCGGALLSEVTLFDVYEGENLGPDRKSLAFRLTFQSLEKTLLDEEVFALKDRILQALSERHGAQLRS